MTRGVVSNISDRGFAFVQSADGASFYVAPGQSADYAFLEEGQHVQFEIVPGRGGKYRAINVSPVRQLPSSWFRVRHRRTRSARRRAQREMRMAS